MTCSKELGVQFFLADAMSQRGCGRESVRTGTVNLKANVVVALFVGAILLSAQVGFPQRSEAQSTQSSANQPSGPAAPEGISRGGYLLQSSIEVGYRNVDLTGSSGMYDTLVDQQTGPRIIDETLSMRSENHQGVLFDDLYVNSFGWGGDPNNALRTRIEKNGWYDFHGTFRRDQNFFDYNLLANPLNPSTSSPSIPALNSPHLFDTTRRMTDIDLTLLPQSRVSFRVGYSHNDMTGAAFSSIHIGTDALLLQPWNTSMNSYRMGVDWRAAPRTLVSFDEFLDYFKGDTDAQLASFSPAQLPGGAGPVELGLPFDTVDKIPCAIPAGSSSLIVNGVLQNVTCNGYFSYARDQRIRGTRPTERVSVRDHSIQRVELVISYSYSDGKQNTPLNELFNGLETRTKTRAFAGTGNADNYEISNVVDAEATVHLTKQLRLVEKLYFWAFRIPEAGNFTEVDSDCTGTCNLLTPLSATAPSTSNTLTLSSFNQDWKREQTDLDWDVSRKFGARIGFRYGDQNFEDFPTFQAGGEKQIEVHEYTALAGVWARPIQGLRINFDLEHTNYDDVIVRMAPRKESRYRFQTNYAPRPWAVVGGSINMLEDANADALTQYIGHNRNYGLTASIAPRTRFGIELAYNYNDAIQNALICFNDTPPTGVTLPFVTSAGSCAASDPNNPLLGSSYYTNHTNFGMFALRVQPVKRATVNIGYSITNVDGTEPQFNILQPLGTLESRYQQPVASLSIDLGHKLAYNTGWNYYQYSEGSFIGPTAPRYFHANSLTYSLRYAF